MGLHAAERYTRFNALRPISQGVQERFGAIGERVAGSCPSAMTTGLWVATLVMSTTPSFDEIHWLGIGSSPSFVRSPEGNGCAERFIRLSKENLLWLREHTRHREKQRAPQRFKVKYNEQWLIEHHRHRSPSQLMRDEMDEIPVAA